MDHQPEASARSNTRRFLMFDPLSRRRFLQASAVAGAFGFWPGSSQADDKKKQSANDKLHVGVIGIAGQGAYDLNEVYASGGGGIVAFFGRIERWHEAGLGSHPPP